MIITVFTDDPKFAAKYRRRKNVTVEFTKIHKPEEVGNHEDEVLRTRMGKAQKKNKDSS